MLWAAACTDSLSCLQTHTHKKLEDRQYPIPCPHPGCSTGIADTECDSILRSTQDRQLLAEMAAEASIPEASKLYCPYPKCSTLMNLWHQGQTCGEAKAATTEDGSLMPLAKQCRWRQCQRCKHMVELSHGCNHMKCRCGADFCYQCGVEYRDGVVQCECELWDEPMLLAEEQRQRQHAVAQGHQPVPNNPHYRTQMCRHYMRGNCWRSEECQFAHAWEQIRPGPG
ncbi:hypothetical protein WJX82_004492 [Trebouxia sp. C0006]